MRKQLYARRGLLAGALSFALVGTMAALPALAEPDEDFNSPEDFGLTDFGMPQGEQDRAPEREIPDVLAFGDIHYATTVDGYLVDPPLVGASVSLISTSGARWETQTDDFGYYQFVKDDRIVNDICYIAQPLVPGNIVEGSGIVEDSEEFVSGDFAPISGFDTEIETIIIDADFGDFLPFLPDTTDPGDDDLIGVDCAYYVQVIPPIISAFSLIETVSKNFHNADDYDTGIINSDAFGIDDFTMELNATYAQMISNQSNNGGEKRAIQKQSVQIQLFVASISMPTGVPAPLAPITTWQETFSGSVGSGTAPLALTSYTGAGMTATYQAALFWSTTAQICNGWILNATSLDPGDAAQGKLDAGCQSTPANGGKDVQSTPVQRSAWYYLQYMAYMIGVANGDSNPILNNAIAAETNVDGTNAPTWTPGTAVPTKCYQTDSSSPVMCLEFGVATGTGITAIPGHYYTVSADFAAMHCQEDNTTVTRDDPQETLVLLQSSGPSFTVTPSGGVDPCLTVAQGGIGVEYPANSSAIDDTNLQKLVGPVYFAHVVGPQVYRVTDSSTSLGMEMYNIAYTSTGTAATSGNDQAFDNPTILDVTPSVYKQFSPSLIAPGGTSTMTVTVVNTSDLLEKDGWTFTDVLPPAVVLADPTNPTVVCDGEPLDQSSAEGSYPANFTNTNGTLTQTISVNPITDPTISYDADNNPIYPNYNSLGDPELQVTGSLLAGQTYCSISVQVTVPLDGDTPNDHLSDAQVAILNGVPANRVSIANSIYVPNGNTVSTAVQGNCGIYNSAGATISNPGQSQFSIAANVLTTFNPTQNGTADGLIGCPGGILKVGLPQVQIDIAPPTIATSGSGTTATTTLTWVITVLSTNIPTSFVCSGGTADGTAVVLGDSSETACTSGGGTVESTDPVQDATTPLTVYSELGSITYVCDGGTADGSAVVPGDSSATACTNGGGTVNSGTPLGTLTNLTWISCNVIANPNKNTECYDPDDDTDNPANVTTVDATGTSGEWNIPALGNNSEVQITVTATIADPSGAAIPASTLTNALLNDTVFSNTVQVASPLQVQADCTTDINEANSGTGVALCRATDEPDPAGDTSAIDPLYSVTQDSDRWDQELTVLPSPDLSLTKAADTTVVHLPGQVVTYTFTVTNTGSTDLVGVNLQDYLIDATAMSFTGLTCSVGTTSYPPTSIPLPIGAVAACTAQYTVTDSDMIPANHNTPVDAVPYATVPAVPDNSPNSDATVAQPLGSSCTSYSTLLTTSSGNFYPNGVGNGFLYNNALAVGSPTYTSSLDGSVGVQVQGTNTNPDDSVSIGTPVTATTANPVSYQYPNDVNCPAATAVLIVSPGDVDTFNTLPMAGGLHLAGYPWLYIGMCMVICSVGIYLEQARRRGA